MDEQFDLEPNTPPDKTPLIQQMTFYIVAYFIYSLISIKVCLSPYFVELIPANVAIVALFAILPVGGVLIFSSIAHLGLAFTDIFIFGAQEQTESFLKNTFTLFYCISLIVFINNKLILAHYHAAQTALIPLTKAIRLYTIEHKRIPESLDDLIPQYLSKIPKTNIPALPHLTYYSNQVKPTEWCLIIENKADSHLPFGCYLNLERALFLSNDKNVVLLWKNRNLKLNYD